MNLRTLRHVLFFLAALSLVGCASSKDEQRDIDVERELARGGPPQCTVQDLGATNLSIQTCVQNYAPETLLEEARMRNPYVVTVIDTPAGKFSNPTMWSVEVVRDGQVLVERQFGAEAAAVETGEEGERVEIRSAVPLPEEGELAPGTYQIRYRVLEEGEVGETTIEVGPLREDATDGRQETDEE